MSSLVGHALAATLCARGVRPPLQAGKEKWLVLIAVLLAVLPDTDLLLYLVFHPVGMLPHRGFSHSLVWVCLSSVLAFLVTARYFDGSRGRVFAVFLLAALTHPFLDYLMGAGPPVPFLAPFHDGGFLFPIRAVPVAYFATTTSGLLALLVHPPTLAGIALEILIFLPLIVLCARPPAWTARALALTSVGAECATLFLYNRH